MSSDTLNAIADDLVTYMWDRDPLEATLMGFREYDGRLADLSSHAEDEFRERRHKLRKRVLDIGDASLDSQELLTKSVIIAVLSNMDGFDIAGQDEYTLSDFPVSPSSALLAYLRMITLTNGAEAWAYADRLREIPRYLQQSLDRLARGRLRGLNPVAHLVTNAVTQIDKYLAADADPLLLPLPDHFDETAGWKAEVDGVLREQVRPAFRAYRDSLIADVLPTARDKQRVGLCHLPRGLDRYEALVQAHTTTKRSAAELHDIGRAQVARIQDEFRVLGAKVFGIEEPAALFRHLNQDPEVRWRARADILQAAEVAVRRAEAEAPKWFGRLPKDACLIAEVPDLEAEGSAPAYYMGPALDGSRKGTYFQNTWKPEERTSFDLESVAFHEAVPGHHFQICIAQEVESLPLIRRLSMFTAYVEGWGLYSERLADEMGLYSSDLQRLGMLSADGWRAARLVVDTGMHAMGWTRQQALEYLMAACPIAAIDAEAEIDRYIAYPGQALSYMTGRLEIERMRRECQQIAGVAFDLRAFHDRVLANGALPLNVFAEAMREWASAQRPLAVTHVSEPEDFGY
ncbi:MAG: DUF885 domain-containing protein [Candidatus Nanopelagicales bacterium]